MPHASMSVRDGIVRRFVAACQDDTRIQAAFIGGSVGSGTADEWADIDLFLVIADDDYDAVFADRHALLDRLGTTVFCESLNIGCDVVAFILDNGIDGELIFHDLSGLDALRAGPITPLIDRAGILEGRTFPLAYPTDDDVADELPVVLAWFWRDTLHFTRAIARERPWTAWAFLEKLRGGCQYLITQSASGSVPRPGHFVPFDGYEALDHIPARPELEMLRESLCPLERDAMLRAVRTLIDIYERLGPSLAEKHDLKYPADAAAVVLTRLDAVPLTNGQ